MLTELLTKAMEEAPSVTILIVVFFMTFRSFKKSSEGEHAETRKSIHAVDSKVDSVAIEIKSELKELQGKHQEQEVKHAALEATVGSMQSCRVMHKNSQNQPI